MVYEELANSIDGTTTYVAPPITKYQEACSTVYTSFLRSDETLPKARQMRTLVSLNTARTLKLSLFAFWVSNNWAR